MVRVSLIALRGPGVAWPSDRIAAYVAVLEQADYEVEVVETSERPGTSRAAVDGLRASTGDLVILVDLAVAYDPASVYAIVQRLSSGDSDLVIDTRSSALVGRLCRRLLGTADPFSRLIGLTREAADRADPAFSPVGNRFAMEMLARVPGRRADVRGARVRASTWIWPSLDDVRLVKRLADERFGNGSRLIQFCFVGVSGMVIDLTCYALAQTILSRTAMAGSVAPVVGGSLVLLLSGLISVGTAVTWNFSINRRLTFNDARGGSIVAQYLRYLFSNLLGIAVSLTLRLALPKYVPFFDRHKLAAAVVGIVAATGISFTMARWFVFGRKAAVQDRTSVRPAKKSEAGVEAGMPTHHRRPIGQTPETVGR